MIKRKDLKESGLSWLGAIPSNWNLAKLKYLAEINGGGTPSSSNDEFWDGEVYWVTTDDLGKLKKGEKFITNTRRKISQKGADSISGVLSQSGDLMISCRAPIGHLGILQIEARCNQGCKSLSPNSEVNNRYLYYYLKASRPIIELEGSGSTFKEISGLKLKNVIGLKPPKDEQDSIADFLDQKTGQIDSLIEKKEKLIKLLERQRQATIDQAVTKGLDPNVPMKDSGVEWIGEIPEGWIAAKLKYNTYMKGRIGWQGLKHEEFTDKGPFLITGMNFKDGKIRWEEVYHITQERYDEAPEIQLKEKDVLITKDGTIGKTLFIEDMPGPCSLNSHLLVMRCTTLDYEQKYLYYNLQSTSFKNYVEIVKTGTTFFGITQEAVSNYVMSFPKNQNEQVEIIEYLDQRLSSIDLTLDQVRTQIEKLCAYKDSLIFHAVTGKIDVNA